MRTHDCDPNLTDSQVLEFCKTGYLPLEGVVPDDVNQRVVDFMDDHAPHIEPGDFANHEPNEILDEDWFIDGVICNPGGGRRGALIAGVELRAAADHVQPPRPHARPRLRLAPRRRLAVEPRVELPAGLLLPAGHDS